MSEIGKLVAVPVSSIPRLRATAGVEDTRKLRACKRSRLGRKRPRNVPIAGELAWTTAVPSASSRSLIAITVIAMMKITTQARPTLGRRLQRPVSRHQLSRRGYPSFGFDLRASSVASVSSLAAPKSCVSISRIRSQISGFDLSDSTVKGLSHRNPR